MERIHRHHHHHSTVLASRPGPVVVAGEQCGVMLRLPSLRAPFASCPQAPVATFNLPRDVHGVWVSGAMAGPSWGLRVLRCGDRSSPVSHQAFASRVRCERGVQRARAWDVCTSRPAALVPNCGLVWRVREHIAELRKLLSRVHQLQYTQRRVDHREPRRHMSTL